jgi:uncharacterized protein (TIGR02246 family)
MHARFRLTANLWFAATMIALGALTVPRAQATAVEDLAKRVQVLEDREEIRALILAYGQAHDHRDYRMFASLFATNGEWIGGLGTARGPDAIFALMDKSIGHHPLPEGSGTFHVLTNDQIVVSGDRASSVTKWLYLTAGDDKAPKLTYLGHYVDQFVRENGRWKFLRRESVSDISPLRK